MQLSYYRENRQPLNYSWARVVFYFTRHRCVFSTFFHASSPFRSNIYCTARKPFCHESPVFHFKQEQDLAKSYSFMDFRLNKYWITVLFKSTYTLLSQNFHRVFQNLCFYVYYLVSVLYIYLTELFGNYILKWSQIFLACRE